MNEYYTVTKEAHVTTLRKKSLEKYKMKKEYDIKREDRHKKLISILAINITYKIKIKGHSNDGVGNRRVL